MPRRVKGHLFLEYVRIIRANKELDWTRTLSPDDLEWLSKQIDPGQWYPMTAYESLGLAILDQVARQNLDQVHRWGRQTIDELRESQPEMFAENDPRETLMRFQILRQTLFDFPAATVRSIHDGRAVLEINYGMSERAEEAAAHQSLGFLERLMEVSGGDSAKAEILEGIWEGFSTTLIAVRWKRPARD